MMVPAAAPAAQLTGWLPPCLPMGLEQACASELVVDLTKLASVLVAGTSFAIELVFQPLIASRTC
jgi:hypothetical protein